MTPPQHRLAAGREPESANLPFSRPFENRCRSGRCFLCFTAPIRYGVDNLNALFLTPLLGTRLWDQMTSEGRIALDTFPEDWKYYTLTFPVARYKHLSLEGIIGEMTSCGRDFYSMPRILRRVWSSLWQRRKPLISLVGNFSYRNNLRLNRKAYADFKSYVKAGV